MKWVTRENAKVDRIACAWLIRRFVDPTAEFLFVPRAAVQEIVEREQATPFDMPGTLLGHREGEASFETIVREYGLGKDSGLAALTKIVHAADVPSDVTMAAEGAGLAAIADGFALVHGLQDQRKLELELPMYDALYAWCSARASES